MRQALVGWLWIVLLSLCTPSGEAWAASKADSGAGSSEASPVESDTSGSHKAGSGKVAPKGVDKGSGVATILGSLYIEGRSPEAPLGEHGPAATPLGRVTLANAMSSLHITLSRDSVDALAGRKEDLVLVADLRKRKETTWSRVVVVQRLSREVRKTSDYLAGNPDAIRGGSLPSFHVNDAGLAHGSPLHAGEDVIWLPFNDLTSDSQYLSSLRKDADLRRALMSINLRELSLRSTAGVEESYQARDGDLLRIRVLGASVPPGREKDIETWRKMDRLRRDALNSICAAAQGISKDSGLRSERLVDSCIVEMKKRGRGEKYASTIESTYMVYAKLMGQPERDLVHWLINGRSDAYALRFTDSIEEEAAVDIPLRKFGIKLDVSPIVALGKRTKDGSVDGFNPFKTTPSLGSNIFLSSDGTNEFRNTVFNYAPGAHVSLLGLGGEEETKFTVGFSHSVLPSLRSHIAVFYGWHDLRTPVWGFTFSPDINFRTLVHADKEPAK